MAQGLLAYTANIKGGGRVKDLKITIEKAENGYIFKLYGEKEIPFDKRNKEMWREDERFEATFVYADLQEGLKETEGFFDVLEKILDKKIEERVKKK